MAEQAPDRGAPAPQDWYSGLPGVTGAGLEHENAKFDSESGTKLQMWVNSFDHTLQEMAEMPGTQGALPALSVLRRALDSTLLRRSPFAQVACDAAGSVLHTLRADHSQLENLGFGVYAVQLAVRAADRGQGVDAHLVLDVLPILLRLMYLRMLGWHGSNLKTKDGAGVAEETVRVQAVEAALLKETVLQERDIAEALVTFLVRLAPHIMDDDVAAIRMLLQKLQVALEQALGQADLPPGRVLRLAFTSSSIEVFFKVAAQLAGDFVQPVLKSASASMLMRHPERLRPSFCFKLGAVCREIDRLAELLQSVQHCDTLSRKAVPLNHTANVVTKISVHLTRIMAAVAPAFSGLGLQGAPVHHGEEGENEGVQANAAVAGGARGVAAAKAPPQQAERQDEAKLSTKSESKGAGVPDTENEAGALQPEPVAPELDAGAGAAAAADEDEEQLVPADWFKHPLVKKYNTRLPCYLMWSYMVLGRDKFLHKSLFFALNDTIKRAVWLDVAFHLATSREALVPLQRGLAAVLAEFQGGDLGRGGVLVGVFGQRVAAAYGTTGALALPDLAMYYTRSKPITCLEDVPAAGSMTTLVRERDLAVMHHHLAPLRTNWPAVLKEGPDAVKAVEQGMCDPKSVHLGFCLRPFDWKDSDPNWSALRWWRVYE